MPEKNRRGAPLGKEGALVADLLKLLLKIRSREIDVASRLLFTRADEMEALAAGVRKNLKVLDGWRYEVFGREAVELVEGKLALRGEGRQAGDDPCRRYGGSGGVTESDFVSVIARHCERSDAIQSGARYALDCRSDCVALQ